jgi:hypothetical protein
MEQVARLSPFLEKHLVLRLLESLPEKHLQDKLALLAATYRVEDLKSTYKELHNQEVPQGVYTNLDKFDQVLEETQKLEGDLAPYVSKERQLNQAASETIKRFAKLKYECGHYSTAAEYLKLSRDAGFPDLWGELTASVLAGTADLALLKLVEETVTEVRDKVWLIHLALFVALPKNPQVFLDFALSEKFRNVVQYVVPEMIKYIISAVILLSKTQHLNHLATLLPSLGDSTFAFVSTLANEFNYTKALHEIQNLENLKNDVFLHSLIPELIENSKKLVFLVHLKIHRKVPLSFIASSLSKSLADAEAWTVALIRDNEVANKIDDGFVVMISSKESLFSQIQDKVKNAALRCEVMRNNLNA